MQPSFAELSEEPPPELLPPLDQPTIDENALSPAQRAWRRDGVLILPRFLPDELMDTYLQVRAAFGEPGGWQSATPYLHVPASRDLSLYPPLMEQLRELIGEQMMLWLCLTGWVSTEGGWHQDDYLNPPAVNSWYAAVWMALDDIDPDSGPFEYVPGSHRWRLLRGDKVRARMSLLEAVKPTWPAVSERFVVPAVDAEIKRRDTRIEKFIAHRGDVLIWHGRLVHRGSKPNVPGMPRKSLITHYSGINHRSDLPHRARDANGQVYSVTKRNHHRAQRSCAQAIKRATD